MTHNTIALPAWVDNSLRPWSATLHVFTVKNVMIISINKQETYHDT